ncbi:MAG: TolC family protein [Polyangia bacterium]
MTTYSPGRRLSVGVTGLASMLSASIALGQIPPRFDGQPDRFDGPRVTFQEAVERSLAQNPQAIVALAELARARALREQIASQSLPTVSTNASYIRLDHDRIIKGQNGAPNNVISAKSQTGGNLLVNVPVSPKAMAAWSHATDNVHVSALSLEDVQRQVALETGRAYLTVINERKLVRVSQIARESAIAHRDFAQQRLQGGIGNRIEAVRAQQELGTSDAQLANAKIQLNRAREALGVIVGMEDPLDAANEPDLVYKDPIDQALDETRNRTDVKTALLRRDAAHHVTRDSWLDYLPNLNMLFDGFYQNPPTLTLPHTGYQATVMLNVPLYDGGFRYGVRRERTALEREAQAALDNTLRQARSEVRVAFNAVIEADRALFAAKEAAKDAREALGLEDLAYHEGTATNLELIDAERQARDTDTQAALAEDTALEARLDLLDATGRFPAHR